VADVTKKRLNFGLDRFSGIYLWVVFIIVFGIWSPNIFLTMSTVHLLASTQAVAGIIAIAVLIPMICGQFDLSVGANANLTGLIAVVVQAKDHWSLPATLAFTVAVGLAIGAVNGFIVVRFNVSSFITTLGMGSVLSAFAVIVTNSQDPPVVASTAWNNMTQYKIFGFQVIIYYLLAFALVAWWVLEHTPVGRYLRATGGNPEAARLSGIRVNRLSWCSLVASGGIAGAGGVLYTSLTGPSLTFGSTLLLPAFAAVFLGSTQLQPGRFNVWGSLIAIFVLATGVQGLQLVSGVQWISDMFNGVALILAVALAASRQGKPLRRRRRLRVAETDPDGEHTPPSSTEPTDVQTELTGSSTT
jgi:ribose transport system permease protein